jgi:hypothetical protein
MPQEPQERVAREQGAACCALPPARMVEGIRQFPNRSSDRASACAVGAVPRPDREAEEGEVAHLPWGRRSGVGQELNR